MPNRDFRDLAEAQRETARALSVLSGQLRQSPNATDVTRLLQPVSAAPAQREATGARAPAPSGANAIPAAEGTLSSALGGATRALQDLGVLLNNNTRTLEATTRELAGGLLGLVSGLAGGSSGGGGFGGFLRGGFGLASLGLRIAGLFRRDREDPVAFSPFELPQSLSVEAANTRNVLARFPQVDRGQSGEIREVAAASQPQIVVNVSAMDSQSFLDRSNDIARAVRDAMLHMHPLNDVIGEI